MEVGATPDPTLREIELKVERIGTIKAENVMLKRKPGRM